jgi:hypothetical protein
MTEHKIWKLAKKSDSGFADCWLRSPPEEISEPCSDCTIRTVYSDPVPLILEWEPGSDKIGDFVWPGGGRVVVTQTAFALLASVVPHLQEGPVEMIQDPKLKRPRQSGRSKPRVWLPYAGPPLFELLATTKVPILPSTTTKVTERCQACGAELLQLVGVEEKGQRWNLQQQKLVPFRRKRIAGKGLFLARSAVGKHPIFRAEPFPSGIMCTDEFRDLVLANDLTDIDFLEFGTLG